MDTVLKMLLIAFISLLAFSSGVYFGKQLSDSDYQLKALESDFNSTHGTAAANGTEQSPEDAINQEEVAALSDKLVSGEKSDLAKNEVHGDSRKVASTDDEDADTHAAPAHGAPAHGDMHAPPAAHAEPHAAPAHAATAAHDEHAAPAHGAKTAPVDAHGAKPAAHADEHAAVDAHGVKSALKPDLSAAAKAAQRVANNASPVEHGDVGHETRVPTSLPKTVGTSQDVEFTVQVASYPTADAAKEHADDLVKKGFPAFPVEASVNGKVWYRVSVGSFKTLREATLYRGQLVKQTTVPSAIVQKIRR